MQKKITASAIISELQSSDMYISVRGRLCDMKTNANGVAVTEAFIDEIVGNEEKYIGIPLCADVRGLINDRTIGHMYNKATGEFLSAIVGSMYHFEKEVVDGNASLIINARIMKRYKAVCNAVAKLFSEGRLKFSFEITCGSYLQKDDGTILIDADESNYLEGAAIVSFPACEDAVAMELVAECLSKGDENMADNENIETVVAEEPVIEAAEEVSETEAEQQVNAEDEEQVNAETENASVIVRQEHEEVDAVHTYDTDSGEETHEYNHHEVDVVQVVEAMAETEDDHDDPDENDNDDEDEKCTAASENVAHVPENDQAAVIAELKRSLDSLVAELKEIKQSISHHEVAETVVEENEPATVTADKDEKKWALLDNPFVSEIKQPKKYKLLDRDS